MVGNDAICRAIGRRQDLRLRLVFAQKRRRLFQNELEQIGFIDRIDVLQYAQDALKPHARVDAAHRQPRQRPVFGAFVLHKDEVPELQIAVFGESKPPLNRLIGALIDVDFRARTTRSHRPHAPEVFFVVFFDIAKSCNAFIGEPNLVVPNAVCLVVVLVNAHDEFRRLEPEMLGQKRPRKANRQIFAIIAKAPVAEHFEKRQVSPVLADFVEVVVLATRANALLHARGALVTAHLVAQKHFLKLVHPRIGKQQRRVVSRNHRRTRHYLVRVTRKKAQKFLSQCIGIHAFNLLNTTNRAKRHAPCA